MDTKTFTNCLNSSRYWIQEKTSKFYIPEQLQHLRTLNDDRTKSIYSPSNPKLSPKSKIQLLQNSPEEFIRFLSESIVNLLHGNLQDLKQEEVLEYRKEINALSLVRTAWKERRRILSTKKDCYWEKQYPHSSLVIYLDMEQFVLVPISVCNSNIKTYRCHKEGTTQLSERRKTQVPDWICEEGYE